MIDTSALTVHASSLPDGSLFMWGLRDSGGAWDVLDFKHIMFAWDTASFYGTFVAEKEWMNREGIELSPLDAMEYFTAPKHAEHVRLKWSEHAAHLRKLAPAIKNALLGERFMPSYESWHKGQVGWKLSLPDELGSLIDSDAQAWIEALIPAWVAANGGGERLQRLEQAFPLMKQGELPADLWLDEEDWLVAIGWQHDALPFRTCLQLAEPENGRSWQLGIVLQDRTDPNMIRKVTSTGELIAGEQQLPEAWLPHLDKVHRDAGKWLRLLPWLPADGDGEAAVLPAVLGHDGAWRFLVEGSARLIAAGYTMFLPAWWDRVRRMRPRLRAKARAASGGGGSAAPMFGLGQIMQFDWKLAIGDLELTEEEFRQLLENKRSLVEIRGQWIQLDPKMLEQIEQIVRQMQQNQGLSARDAIALHLVGNQEDGLDPADFTNDQSDESELAKLQLEIELSDQLEKLIDALTHTSHIPLVKTDPEFKGELRQYQQEGFSWLLFLRQFGLGGCLADDMGLGKTIQWITYLLAIKREAEHHRANLKSGAAANVPYELMAPSLLICPTSVLGNWQMELKRFAPTLKVHLHYGPQRLRDNKFSQFLEDEKIDLVLTSYNLSHIDEQELSAIHWNSICLDEAQNIKNAYTKQASSIQRLSGYHRIAMTGTPIENRLSELWSIFEFINPGYLGTEREFNQRYVSPIERERDAFALQAVQRLIRPFLLRRVKNDPAIQLDLPEKNETKVFVSLTAEQGSLYENYIQDLFARLDKLSVMERRGYILAALTRLKQLCNHPSLLLKEGLSAPWQQRSNKVERLTEMVHELRDEGDKCLIFTQYVETGYLLQRILQEELGEQVSFLHGGTTKQARDDMIARFQNSEQSAEKPINIFILSLKAGGIGLNLTAANHVFHFDRWWNPAVENQATDRAYRIGQSRNVQVHKFITLGTLEERIDELIEGKLNLSEGIVGKGEQWITELSESELRDLFSLRSEWVETP
ncbi:DEAD/DEAH box helicase [Paenibacillus albiflavus]|uniref:DEAD/DEAH box helicase n=2 Tax=Paenibacillus albiflavus TaxID=2545760 RepID=A0A4R4EH64_9BACL|nr:DEAD/DEAH box helicase [Paenibacillus albiflavus]TCZ78977.1 DEAD/DEAH box helicase [Paenibacillus albiflavus]